MAETSTAPDTQAGTAGAGASPTLYVNNLKDKPTKAQLSKALYSVFSAYGKVLDIVVSKKQGLRGQAWVVFESVSQASAAMSELQNFPVFDKPMRIAFAHRKSFASAKADGEFNPAFVAADKAASVARAAAREAQAGGVPGSAGPAEGQAAAPRNAPISSEPPSDMLLVSNLPVDMDEAEVTKLFNVYDGFQTVRVVPGRGLAFVQYDTVSQSTPALQGMHNYALPSGQRITVAFAKK